MSAETISIAQWFSSLKLYLYILHVRFSKTAESAENQLVVYAGFMFTGAAVVSGAGGGDTGMLEGLVIEKLNGWDIEKRYRIHLQRQHCRLSIT